MFDIGFWELCIIAIVALLILGPERLPTAARTAGLWIGKIQRMIGNVKSEIDRELQLDELRQRLKEEEIAIREQSEIDEIKDLTENTISDISSEITNLKTEHNLIHDEATDSETESEDETDDSTNDSGHGEYEPEILKEDDSDSLDATQGNSQNSSQDSSQDSDNLTSKSVDNP